MVRAPTAALPSLLLLLTVVAGSVDAISFLALGHVFVVNMTGNIVFIGFAAAGVTEVSLSATLTAVFAFVIGSTIGGRLARRFSDERLLSVAAAVKLGLVIAALVVVILAHASLQPGLRETVIGLLALAMGIQNAAARRIGFPDLTTTVLTMTLTALGSDSSLAGGTNPRWGWRLLSVCAMLVGAFAGGLCILRAGIIAALILVVALLAVAAVLGHFGFRAALRSAG